MRFLLPVSLITVLLFVAVPQAQVVTPPSAAEPEVLTRGPVHEAFATAVTGETNPGMIATKLPPEMVEELPPDEKPTGEHVIWITGYWAWDEERGDYIWISGFWRVPPPGRQWVPGAWRQIGASQWQWTTGYWAPADHQHVEYVPPPPAPIEAAAPPSPGENYLYAPGVWVYHPTLFRYVWRPGFWFAHRIGWVYIPAHYIWTPAGCVFVEGYWDWTLADRGCLFAPVYFAHHHGHHHVYRPTYIIYDDALFGAMFVRPGCRMYYFGDYFEERYVAMGYHSWIDVHIGGGGHDPLWVYYHHHHRLDPTWTTSMRTVYAGRYKGEIARPPRTFELALAATKLPPKPIVTKSVLVDNIVNTHAIEPLKNVDQSKLKLNKVSDADKTTAIKNVQLTRQASVDRVKIETVHAFPQVSVQGQLQTQPRKLELPKTTIKTPIQLQQLTGAKALPQLPTLPAFNLNLKPAVQKSSGTQQGGQQPKK